MFAIVHIINLTNFSEPCALWLIHPNFGGFGCSHLTNISSTTQQRLLCSTFSSAPFVIYIYLFNVFMCSMLRSEWQNVQYVDSHQ